ncbi:cytochrome b562 [Luteolibacter algae]|uniref:Cytochrome b562 n=1 Tax=Luteolibacter algae TaxID=454151 RepID=A0ABW5D4R7_9BACT
MKLILSGLVASLMLSQPTMADDDTPLAKQMEAMNDAYKAMRREKDTAKGAALAREAQDAMIKAISEVPTMVSDMPEGAPKSKASAEYRAMTGQLIAILANIEVAFLDGDTDKVAELVTEMRESKKVGHDRFIEE